MRTMTFAAAVNEATHQALAADPRVFIMGLGVPDPGGIFGSTLGLRDAFGPGRVMDMPVAENGMMGIAIGAALAGMRPIITHQRVDFMLLALEQLVNQAAKWHYMFHGAASVPLVIRAIIGRGWGQGPQHSQSLHSWFAHIPGLITAMPFTPEDAKGLLLAAVQENNPVLLLEHRWLFNMQGPVKKDPYTVPFGRARIVRKGDDVTILAVSHMVYESLRAAAILAEMGVSAEVVDIRTLRPLDEAGILQSVMRTGRVVVADPDWGFCGFSAELLALVAEKAFSALTFAPQRVALPEYPQPTAPALSTSFYPGPAHIAAAALKTLMKNVPDNLFQMAGETRPHDVPDMSFTGPF